MTKLTYTYLLTYFLQTLRLSGVKIERTSADKSVFVAHMGSGPVTYKLDEPDTK